MQDRPTFGALSNQGRCHSCSVENTTKNLPENKFSNKNNFGENTYDTISIMGNVYHSLYVRNCMELHENKFLIHENCLISIFGQPGRLVCLFVLPFEFPLLKVFAFLSKFLIESVFSSRDSCRFLSIFILIFFFELVAFICTIFASEALLPSSFGTDKFENSFCCRVAVSFFVPCFLGHWLYWRLADCGGSLLCGSEYTLDNANIYWQTAWRYYKIDELTAGNVAKYHRRECISDYQIWRVPLLDFRKCCVQLHCFLLYLVVSWALGFRP